ncbi:MAG: efflux RND transporter periplasmic adaptor subunit [Betaproteobacteria bacterium]|nr:efflux RND transporter periplasmic adaptor subunit [Betaproteobacteria bacterium]
MNKNLTLALVATGLVGAGIGAGYWFGGHRAPVGVANTTGAPVAASAATVDPATGAAGKKPLYYYDPMYPQQKFDKPGKSPFMDMMLVPVYSDDGADTGSVRISPRVVQNLGVRTALVTSGSIDKKLQVVGTVAFDERAVVIVQARVNGYIEKLFVRAPLDAVVKGQPLAEILAPDWVSAQEEYLALKNSPLANDALRQAARQRLSVLGMPEATIAAIDASGKTRPRITLSAPASGVIGELAVREGMTVMPGAMLFRINGLSTVWINADVPETQVAWLKPGSMVEASVPAYPGDVFKGRVTALLPEVNAGTRTLKARIEFVNAKAKLAPGMFATVSVSAPKAQEVLLVPTEAVIQTGTRTVVLVASAGSDGKQQFTPVDVEIGAEANDMTEIKSGLTKGAKVVLSGQFLIDSEASLKASGTRMSESKSEGMKADAPMKGASTSATATHKGEGKVEDIGKGVVTISHGPIPTLQMGAMTMEYKLPATGVPADVKVGASVSFEMTQTPQGEFALVKIQRKTGGGK